MINIWRLCVGEGGGGNKGGAKKDLNEVVGAVVSVELIRIIERAVVVGGYFGFEPDGGIVLGLMTSLYIVLI